MIQAMWPGFKTIEGKSKVYSSFMKVLSIHPLVNQFTYLLICLLLQLFTSCFSLSFFFLEGEWFSLV